MVIGSLFFRPRLLKPLGLLALALSLLVLRSSADDQINKKDGTTISGQILSVSDGQVMVASHASNGSLVKIPYFISDIKSITMAVPPTVTKALDTDPAGVIAALEPVVKQFAGLPVDWVVEAMGRLADAYAAQGQAAQAAAIYTEIDTLYPGSKYHAEAVAGKAQADFAAGKFDEALALVQPLVDQANQDIAPSPSGGALYARVFLVYGEVLEAQNKPQQALEAYLTVKTMFYQDPALMAQAEQHAQTLRDHNPGVGVE
jgi:tetratricopeptide (TPR) repeat protein